MPSRKRNSATTSSSTSKRRDRQSGGNPIGKEGALHRRIKRRQHLLESLEPRQLLAGPQLIGIQPNEGELIVDGTVRDTAPRSLTFRFDEDQQIDRGTYAGIRITRSGPDGVFDSLDDIRITPGSVSPGETSANEVVVRFAEALPDDRYRIDVFGFDDPGRDILGLRNVDGELLIPRGNQANAEQINFELRLGAQIEAIVPQPVVRLDNGLLVQRRNEILVYFNEDPLFVENDPGTGLPTSRSAENPRFYQLLLTKETVRTTDDTLYLPERVIYDSATHTSRLIFAGDDINTLPGVPVGGGTFRLRIGTAVDNRAELIIEPTQFSVVPQVHSNLGVAADLRVEFVSKVFGESIGNREISFINRGVGGLSVALDPTSGAIVYDIGGATVSVQQLQAVTQTTPTVNAVVSISFSQRGIPGAGGGLLLPLSLVGSPPLMMVTAGDTLATATDVGVFGQASDPLTSLLISESIDPQTVSIQLPGSSSDPGRATVPRGPDSGFARAINARFGPDVTDGITEIDYNFQAIFSGGVGTGFPAQTNNITDVQKRRIREALSLWSQYVGVQFRETTDSGITFAVGSRGNLLSAAGSELREVDVLDADLRIDPSFAESAMVFSSEANFKLNYGEDFFRKAMTGIGFLLGLEQNDEATSQTLMSLDPEFLNATIDPAAFVSPIDPFVPALTTFQQTINPLIDSQTIEDPVPNSLEGPEPVFPGNQDILHGNLLYRQDSIDVDLYRFEVSLSEGREFGTLTVESFAERLADSSLLDTSLTLFKDTSASATRNFGLGTTLSVQVNSLLQGNQGNRSRIEFVQTDRAVGDTAVRVNRIIGDDGRLIPNAIEVDVPRRSLAVNRVTVGQVIDAIHADVFASTLFALSVVAGSRNADISGSPLNAYSPIRLSGGGTVQVARNDDYFSSDSLLTAKLTNGVYYIGVSAAGNDRYDPSLADSGFGGRTQGQYELLVKFEPQVSQNDVIRDLDSDRAGVPGTVIDGDLDGTPGGVKNFWFQTRPLQRVLQVTSTGAGIVPGQTMTVTGANGVSRQFEFVPIGGTARPGNVPVVFQPAGSTGNIASALAGAININSATLGVSAQVFVDPMAAGSVTNVLLTGERTLDFSNNFQGIEALGRTLFVDKVAGVVSNGSLTQPFNNISSITQASAFDSALPGDIVRILGNGGQDGNISTPTDNFAYQIGISEVGGTVLPDGRHMDVPKGVTAMIDAGAAFKLRSSVVSVGSNNLLTDRSGGALQVLGTPRLLKLSDPSPVGAASRDVGIVEISGSGNVVFTSTRDRSVDAAASSNSPAPTDGNWGGLIFRSDFDRSEGRFNREDEGIFLQTVNHADIRFGGGSNILINSVQQTVNPIQMIDARPTITFNTVTNNAGAAMSASPDAFLETRFQEPRFQQAGAFTAEYSRVGPDIKQNRVVDNSINGLFIRTVTVPNQPAREITVAARIDDVDIVHYIAENVVIAGRPGGPIQDGFQPNATSVVAQLSGGGSLAPGDYQYRVTFVDASGFESLPSDPTAVVTTTLGNARVQLLNLPVIPSSSEYRTRRLYRLNPATGEYRLVAQLNRSESTFIDNGSISGGAVLDLNREGIRGRLDGSLVIDPNTVVKFRGARLELGQSTQLLAEGNGGQRVVFTSALDDRFGAGGSFDTNEDADIPGGGALPQRGDWSGIYAGPTSKVSLDHAVVAYGGGISLIEGGQSRGFAALELQQASARVTNSRFEYNDNAQDGSGPVGRNGRLAVTPATIYARFTQPIIVGNQFVDNHGSLLDIDLASLTDEMIIDVGRQTGGIDKIVGLDDNHGPLVRRNTTDSTPGDVDGERQLNGMRIRGGELATASVWDDVDIAHVLFDSVTVGNQVSSGGLTLKSRPDESLIIKMSGRGTPNSATAGTGITATGATGDIADRIGGTVHVLGLPGAPVVLTSLKDDSVGAGRKIDGTAQTDTNGDSFASRPDSNDWRSLLFDGLSNDRNTAVVVEQELSTAAPPGLNATVNNAQILGDLAERLTGSNEQLRLGFEVHGFISAPGDIDTYAFTAAAGTRVWIDMDQTSLGLDSMIEVVDDTGRVLARSDDSFAEVDDPSLITALDPDLLVGALGDRDDPQLERWVTGDYYDVGSTNLRDAGLQITLPGVTGTRSDYFIRVRAASADPTDVAGGLTTGAYKFQVRLQEDQEFPGSVVRFADIRYANHGIHVQGLPGSSPLLGEAQENESADPFSPAVAATAFGPVPGGYGIENEPRYPTDLYANNDLINGGYYSPFINFVPNPLNSRPQNLGDLTDSKTGTISVGGELSDISDIDFYQIDIGRDGSLSNLQRSTTFDVDYAAGFDRPDTNISVFYSPTGNPNSARLVLFGENSNVLDDQSSPLDSQLIGELLQRGSISEGDPLIGPVALQAGSYFIAITESGRAPLELTDNTRVRRAPIESSVRIFDDHIEVIGGSTAQPPRERGFVDTSSSGWTVTTDRSTDFGHARMGPFQFQTLGASSTSLTTGAADPFQNFESPSPDIVFSNVDDDDPDLPGSDDFAQDTIVLAFNENVPAATRTIFLQQQRLQVRKTFNSIDAIVVTTQPGADILAETERLTNLPEIRYAEPDYFMSTDVVPTDTRYPQMWSLNNTGQTGGTIDADIDMPEAWDITTGTQQTVIAVLDSGIDLTHPDLVSNLWVNPGEIAGDGIDNDGNGYIDDINGIDPFNGDTVPQDADGHGTHTAGTTAAVGNNALGTVGVNWNAKIMPVQVCGVVVCSGAAILEGIDYVTTMKSVFGINIVVSNNSYGGGFPSQAVQDAIAANITAGVPFVASAGNSSSNNDFFPSYPASYNLDGIISVAATDHNDLLSGFSNFGGGSVDLAAPGTDILSTYLGGGYQLLSGTSMASPHVAGVVALLAGFAPTATVTDLKNAIMLGADVIPNLAGTSVTGARLNAAGALAFLQSGNQNNESIFFDRSEAVGTLSSNAFDLTGYSDADLPRLYFDYFVDSAPADSIVVRAFSNEQPIPVQLNVDLNAPANQGTWRQAIVSLSQFAGNTGIVVEIEYTTDLADTTAEGLYLDNFIVGFAERGESVSGALFGRADFTQTTSGTPGRYQLEIRPATEYSEPIEGGVRIERSLASDPKLVDSLWLSIPSGRGIVRYETFNIDILNVTTGLDETLTFQFQPTELGLQEPSLVDPLAIPVTYSRADTSPQIIGSLSAAISGLVDYAFYSVRASNVQLVESFDTNDRHAEQTTLVAPSADQISDGDRFTLSDGSRSVTFEFSTDSSVTFGNIRVPFAAGDSSSVIARRMIEVINSGSVQGRLNLRASTISGDWNFNSPTNPEAPPSDARVAIHGLAVGNFDAVTGVADAPPAGTPLPVAADGTLILSAIFHDGVGDENTVRTQGQVIVENNQITEVHAIGIWSDPGHRGIDPEDDRSQTFVPAPLGNDFLQLPPVGNSPLGAVLNLPELNDSVVGGLAPGLVAQNNIVDRAGFAGIKVDGETRPFVIEWNGDPFNYFSGGAQLQSRGDILVPDGFIMAIDAAGTRVVFEFEDISGAPTNLGGSGVAGGDGFIDGHVPIYYRLGGGPTYNPSDNSPFRDIGYTGHELMMAIYESIQGSILVSNGLVELVRPTLGPSLNNPFGPIFQSDGQDPLGIRIGGPFLDFVNPALYLEGVTAIYSALSFQKTTHIAQLSLNSSDSPPYPFPFDYTYFDQQTGATFNGPAPMMPIAEAPQPLAKIINNTIRGEDGTEGALLSDGSLSRAVELPTAEPNDTFAGAVDTKLEVSHRGGYFADGVIGDNVGRLPDHQDVDFYQVELAVGDRLIVDIDTVTTSTLVAGISNTDTTITINNADVGQLPLLFTTGTTSLTRDITSADTVITVANSAGLPNATPFTISVSGEVMLVTAVNGNNLTVTRSPGTAVAHSAASPVSALDPFTVRISNEYMQVTVVNGNVLTVTRTAAVPVAHSAGEPVSFASLQGLAALVRIFDSNGIEVFTGEKGTLPNYLKPGSSVEFPLPDFANPRDSFVDFTALKKDTYYVGVSSEGNDRYEAKSLSERTDGTGGTGSYQIGIEVLAPRNFTFSLDNHPLTPFGAEVTSGTIRGTTSDGGPANAPSLVGTTFTISQIPDYLIPTRTGDAYAGVNADGNRVTFEFTSGVQRIVLANGNINVPILLDANVGINGGHRVPDIMRAIANAINGYLNNPALPNNEVGNGPDGRDGPITRVRARAMGGAHTDNIGIENFIRTTGFPRSIFGSLDFTTGFGHDRRESGDDLNIVPDGTFTDSQGAAELYVLIENAAKIELSPEARAAGLKLGPDNSRLANGNLRNPEFATESDQLLIENGIFVSSGVSAAILNNVVVNAHQSIVQEESSVFGFGGRIDHLNLDLSVKKGSVVAAGNAFQYDEQRNTQMRSDVSWWVVLGVNVVNRNPALDGSLSTDLRTGPSNIAGGNSDFNFVIDQPNTPGQTPGNFITFIGDDLLSDGAAGRFTPSRNAAIIDSAVDSIQANVALSTLNALVGIPTISVLAPNRDHSGQLRADEPTMAPPGGIGANVFKDRGALDLADFVGPIAALESPLDNDFAGSDSDPSSSFVNRSAGVFSEFRILLQDLGDDSDPFVGSGIDDSTVVVSQIDGLRKPGANVALFENDRLLEEGIDYTFSYDESRGVITLKPLAGIWRSDRSYRIQVNNRDRTVLIAPDPSDIVDGEQLSIVDTNGATLVFEVESGFSLIVPETITLTVPREGTNAGGLSEGDRFQIDDGINPASVFEFKRTNATQPGTIPVNLPPRPTPSNPGDLTLYLQEIANNIAVAIRSVADMSKLDVDVRLVGDHVIIGGEPGTRATTSDSGLEQAARTLALQVPTVGIGVGGIADGDTFLVNNGSREVTFEFETGNGLNDVTNTPIAVGGLTAATDIALAIRDAITNSGLGLNALIEGNGLSVYLNLPTQGSAVITRGRLTVVGLSRPAADGDTIIITPIGDNNGSMKVTLEINRTDSVNPTVTAPNVPVNITRATTADELASQIRNVLLGLPSIAGLNPDDVQVVNGGLLAIGGDEGLGFTVTGSSLSVVGTPGVTGSSTIQVFGPLLLSLPLVGGSGVLDGTTIGVTDDVGVRRFFEFDDLLLNNNLDNPAAVRVPFNSFDPVDTLAANLVAAINAAGLVGINAQYLSLGQISMGRIDATRVEIPVILRLPNIGGAGIADETIVTLIAANGTRQVFEFDSNGALNDPTAIRVPYTVADSVDFVADSLATAINASSAGIIAETLGPAQVSLGMISRSQVELPNGSLITVVALQGAPLRRAIVNDGEVLTLQQGSISVSFEFESLINGGGVSQGNIPVVFQPGSTAGAVAMSLAAAINSNKRGLEVDAVAVGDEVLLNDQPGTIINVLRAPTLNVTGVPGGATPIIVKPGSSAIAVKQALVTAINSVSAASPLIAADRGGATFFVENGQLFEGPLQSFFLPSIKDMVGNPIKPNREDNTTQFTILLPTVGLDFGDAPDPRGNVAGQYPTLLVNDGARHVVTPDLKLGTRVDAEPDAQMNTTADGDDLIIEVSSVGTLFNTSVQGGFAEIQVQSGSNPATRDGDTFTLTLGDRTVTLELDIDGIFKEANFAIAPTDPTSAESVAQAIPGAIAQSGLNASQVTVDGNRVLVYSDDEDGVSFVSELNPQGNLNKGITTPISVTVTGGGVLEAWIDFNADGDWNDPGEQIIARSMPEATFRDTGSPLTRVFDITVPNFVFPPATAQTTYARFRISREGGLGPNGLALSGEVEDYAILIVPGSPPTLTDSSANRTFNVDEDRVLQVLDVDGNLTQMAVNDDGLLRGVTDPDGDDVAIISQDVGLRTLMTPGGTVAGELNLASDGTFTFVPALDFNGVATFTARVTDLNTLDPSAQIVNSRPIVVTINVTPVNDPPFATTADVVVNRTINEDQQQTFTTDDLITPFYVAGPSNESGQALIIQSAGSFRGNAISSLGGSITIANGGTTLIYTPPADYNGLPPDTFTYVVADVVGPGQLSESATKLGTVTLNINAVNDPPRLTNDSYFTDEDTALTIPIRGTATNPGILDNDAAGPPDEVAAGQTISLQAGQFPKATFRGGSVRLEGTNLIYTPPALFSGSDQFEYTVVDDQLLSATGTVSITIGGVNNAPRFVGIDGDPSKVSLSFIESKFDPVQQTFNLTSWFNDPESDPLTFSVTTSNSSIVAVGIQGELLTLTLPPFAFGNVTLAVTARDSSGLTTTQQIPVAVENTPDPPRVIGTLNPLNGTEDQLVTANLTSIFADPDNEQLQYSVARLGNLISPTATQIAQHPLVQSIQTLGNELRITLKPDQSGSVEIELAASDGSQRVSDTFTLIIAPVPDSPIARPDGYNVPVGATLQVLNPADGVLRNDSDADGDVIQVDLASVVNPTRGTLQINADGTFIYTSQSGQAGDVDTFTYQATDSTGRRSAVVTVSLNLNQSLYQNPIQDLEMDVNADGRVSAIDALRVINLLQRRLGGQGGELLVSAIGSPPPDYVDVDGNGRVTANDALRVINELNRRNVNGGQGEFVTPAGQVSSQLGFASTTAFASASTTNLPVRNLSPVSITANEARDVLLTAGLQIDNGASLTVTELLSVSTDNSAADHPASIDDAITSLLDDMMLDASLG